MASWIWRWRRWCLASVDSCIKQIYGTHCKGHFQALPLPCGTYMSVEGQEKGQTNV